MSGVAADEAPDCARCGVAGKVLYTGLADRELGVPGEWRLLECAECRLVWLDPRPRPEEVPKLYAGKYYTHDSGPVVSQPVLASIKGRLAGTSGLAMMLARLGPVRDERAAERMWIDSEPGRLLDVGCGDGAFGERMGLLGWEVAGVEPDPAAASRAAGRGLQVFAGDLQSAAFPPDSFDVVTLSHVIEHVHDPVEMLSRCRHLLKPGGRLVVLTPNPRSLGRRLLGRDWYAWEPPRHLFLYPAAVLTACAQEAGFENCIVRTTARASRHLWHLSRTLGRRGGLDDLDFPFRLRLGGLVFWATEYLLNEITPAGEELLLQANRPRP